MGVTQESPSCSQSSPFASGDPIQGPSVRPPLGLGDGGCSRFLAQQQFLELPATSPAGLVPPRGIGPLPFPALLSRSPGFCSIPSPQLLLGVEIAFQLPFAFPINPDSAIKSAGGVGRKAAAGTGPLGAVASSPLPFRPRLLPAPPCAAGRTGRGTGARGSSPPLNRGWRVGAMALRVAEGR